MCFCIDPPHKYCAGSNRGTPLMARSLSYILASFFLFLAQESFCRKMEHYYDSVYKVHFSLPRKWSYAMSDSLLHKPKSRKYGMADLIFTAASTKKTRHTECAQGCSFYIPDNAELFKDFFDNNWNGAADSVDHEAHYRYTKRGGMINDSVKSIERKYVCNEMHGRIKKPDMEEVTFLFAHNGQCYSLNCTTTIRRFRKYKRLFYKIAASVSFG